MTIRAASHESEAGNIDLRTTVPIGAMGIFFAIGLSIMGWAVLKILSHDTELAAIKASRYSAADARTDQRQSDERFRAIEARQSDILAIVSRLEPMQKAFEARVEKRLERIENALDGGKK